MTNATHNMQDILKKFKSAESSDAVIVLNSKCVYLQITLKVCNYNFSVYTNIMSHMKVHTHTIVIQGLHIYTSIKCIDILIGAVTI